MRELESRWGVWWSCIYYLDNLNLSMFIRYSTGQAVGGIARPSRMSLDVIILEEKAAVASLCRYWSLTPSWTSKGSVAISPEPHSFMALSLPRGSSTGVLYDCACVNNSLPFNTSFTQGFYTYRRKLHLVLIVCCASNCPFAVVFSWCIWSTRGRLVVSWHFSLQVLCEDFDGKGREYISTKERRVFAS